MSQNPLTDPTSLIAYRLANAEPCSAGKLRTRKWTSKTAPQFCSNRSGRIAIPRDWCAITYLAAPVVSTRGERRAPSDALCSCPWHSSGSWVTKIVASGSVTNARRAKAAKRDGSNTGCRRCQSDAIPRRATRAVYTACHESGKAWRLTHGILVCQSDAIPRAHLAP